MKKTLAVALVLAASSVPAMAAGLDAANPYAGQQTRAIKALSEKEVADLEAGRGMGLAKAAELNGYPGPLHALELADDLRLTAAQREALERQKARMTAAARKTGAELLALEIALDDLFASGTATAREVADLTSRIGETQGRLRAVHLITHIEAAEVLDADQRSAYHRLRGYGDGDGHGTARHTGHGDAHDRGAGHGGR